MIPAVQSCISYLTPHPREVVGILKYHIHHFDSPHLGGKRMLNAVDQLPSTETFDDFLSCSVPRASRATRTIREHHSTMFSPASALVRNTLTGLAVENFDPLEVQALLELRDRLGVRAHTSTRLLARLDDRIAAADRSMRAVGQPESPWSDLKETAFMLIALKHTANHPRLGPQLLGRTPPRRVASADMTRLAVVLLSGIGAVTLVVRSAVSLGAIATSSLNHSLQHSPLSGRGPARRVISADVVRFSVVLLTAAGAITLVARSGVMFGSMVATPLLVVNNAQ